MSVETEKPQQKQNIFAKEWTKWASLCSAVLAICMLFLPLLTEYVKDGEGNKHYTLKFLWDLFGTPALMATVVVVITLLVASIPLVFFGTKKSSLAVGASMSSLIAGALMIILPTMYLDIVGCKEAIIEAGLVFGFTFAVVSAVFALSFSYKQVPMNIRDIAEDAILVAAAFALNFVKIPVGADGGSINFQMLPLFIIALRHGPLQGLISGGIVFGLLTCVTDGYGLFTFPFDYLIGFGSVAVLGFFRSLILSANQKTYNVKGELFIVLAAVLATSIRLLGSTVSSIVFYGTDFIGGLVYNIPYVIPSGVLALVVLAALYGPLLKLNKRFPVDEKAEEAE